MKLTLRSCHIKFLWTGENLPFGFRFSMLRCIVIYIHKWNTPAALWKEHDFKASTSHFSRIQGSRAFSR